jgi:hypothetical protein
MEMPKLSTKELRSLKVGDVVVVQNGFSDIILLPPKAIVEIEHCWGTDALPLITLEGHDPNWVGAVGEETRHEDCLQFNACWVRQIVSRSQYVLELRRANRNVFAEYVAKRLASGRYWNYPRLSAPKGQFCGRYREMDELFILALAKLPYELTTALHEERAKQLWQKAGSPGLVRSPDPILEDNDRRGRHLSVSDLLPSNEHYFVREKPFCRFVRQNWSKLVMTKAEMDIQADEYLTWEQDYMRRDMEDDMGGWPADWADTDDNPSERYHMTAC